MRHSRSSAGNQEKFTVCIGASSNPHWVLRRTHPGDRHAFERLLPTINAVVRCEFPAVFLSRNSRRGVPLHRGKTFLRNNLTRRANHRHMSSIARIKPAPGDRPRAFLIGIFESDGGRTSRRHILPTHRRRSVASELPSEPFIVEHDLLGKPLRTFPEHAPLAGTRERAGTRRGQVHVRPRPCRDDPICGSRQDG